MDKFERLKVKYGGGNGDNQTKKEMSIGPRGNREAALGRQGGKPKDMKKTVKRLISYLKSERKLLIIAILCAVINTVAGLMASYRLRPIMNNLVDGSLSVSERVNNLIIGLLIMAFIYAINVFSQWLQQRLMLTVSQRSLKKMREELYQKMMSLPVRYYDKNTAGDLMSRFTNDVDTVGEMLNTTLVQIISGGILIVGTVVLMLYTNLILGGITILMAPVLTMVSKQIIKKSRGAYKDQQKNLGMLNGYAEETISGQKVVKVFGHEDTCIEEFEYLNNEVCEAQIKAQFRSGIMGPVTHQMCNMIYAITAAVGALMIVYRGFDIGGLTISLNYTRQFNRPINEISMQMNTVFAAIAGAERVFAVLDEKSEEESGDVRNDVTKLKGHVVIDNVSFGYRPNHVILHNISLYAKPGQKIAFVGSTGAGKTTVTSLLTRFYELSEGDITIDGISINKIPRSVLRSNITMVLQDTHLFTGTVRENIRYGRLDATDEEVVAAAKVASADSFICQLENGYDTILENDGANLSQGQRQLISIARAAISNAPILILDEATSSVDTRTEKHIEEGMDAIMENRTTFVIAHRLSTVRKSNAIMVLEKGVIVERGDHDELVAKGGRYADLYNEIAELE